jgi:nucleotide-binding universal stress UspA family protein
MPSWHGPPNTILVGVDFGDASARALAIAGALASGFGARLRALHAERFEPPPYFTIEQIAALEAERQAAQAAAAAHLAEFAGAASGQVVEPVIVDAGPVNALLDAAHGADLIVLGTHGRSGPGRWWLGSVAERVVRGATIPVLVTRAAAAPGRAVFERLAVVQDRSGPDAAARAWAEHLARLAGGSVTEAGSLAQCQSAALQQASLVVLSTSADHPSWGFDDVARVIGGCDRPVLFVRAG